jgi:hypothetical protein
VLSRWFGIPLHDVGPREATYEDIPVARPGKVLTARNVLVMRFNPDGTLDEPGFNSSQPALGDEA